MVGKDYDYKRTLDLISRNKKMISNFSIEEVKAVLTYIERGEYFVTGYIAGMIENGTLLDILKQLDKLYKENN